MLVAGPVIGSVQRFLEIDPSGGIRGTERDGDDRQPVAETDGPEVRGPPLLGPADHHRIVALGPAFLGHGGPSTQEVDFDEVGRAPEQLAALGEVLLAVFTGPLVRRAQELDRGHQLAALAIPDFQERHLLDVLLRQPNLRRGFDQSESCLRQCTASRLDQ